MEGSLPANRLVKRQPQSNTEFKIQLLCFCSRRYLVAATMLANSF